MTHKEVNDTLSFSINPIDCLELNTGPLNETILNLANEIRQHEMLLQKLPILETTQSTIRKDLNDLTLNASSNVITSHLYAQKEKFSNPQTDDECHFTIPSKTLLTADVERIEAVKNNSVKRLSKSRISYLHTKTSGNNNSPERTFSQLGEVRRDLTNIMAITTQIQREHDSVITQAFDNDEQIETLKEIICVLERKLAGFVKTVDSQHMKKNVEQKFEGLQNDFNVLRTSSKFEINENVRDKLLNVKG